MAMYSAFKCGRPNITILVKRLHLNETQIANNETVICNCIISRRKANGLVCYYRYVMFFLRIGISFRINLAINYITLRKGSSGFLI
jgi:hypothetical protein